MIIRILDRLKVLPETTGDARALSKAKAELTLENPAFRRA